MSVTLIVPPPPSANRLWRRAGHTIYKSKAYRDWLDECSLRVRGDKRKAVPPPCRVLIEVHGGHGFTRARDLDNCIKPVCDLLQLLGIIPNDRVVELPDIQAVYCPPAGKSGPAWCFIVVSEVQS